MLDLLPIATARDWVQVLVLALFLFYSLRALLRSPARHAALGVAGLLLVYTALRLLRLDILTSILAHVFQVGLVLLVILFHDETRSLLSRAGKRIRRTLRLSGPDARVTAPGVVDEVAVALERLAAQGEGALIAIEMADALDEHVTTGYPLGAQLTSALLEAVFTSRSPMHDGAIVIRASRVLSAGVVFPLYEGDTPLLRRSGMRHRAALGLSTETDAAVLVLSEERGTVHLARSGEFTEVQVPHLRRELLSILAFDEESPPPAAPDTRRRGWASRTSVRTLRMLRKARESLRRRQG